MARKDKYHQAVRKALVKDGWKITKDPYTVPTKDMDFFIDLGAEREVIGAEKGGEEIAVEIKSLLGSYFYDFYQALGQYLIYRLAMNKQKQSIPLFLAIPEKAFDELILVEIFRESWVAYSVNLLVFHEDEETIIKWLRH